MIIPELRLQKEGSLTLFFLGSAWLLPSSHLENSSKTSGTDYLLLELHVDGIIHHLADIQEINQQLFW